MKLYETKGECLALHLDGNEVKRLLTTAHDWQWENDFYRCADPYSNKEYPARAVNKELERARDAIEQLLIDRALIPVAERLADGKRDEVENARLWAVFSAYVDTYPPMFGTTLDPVDFDQLEQFVEFGSDVNTVFYSRPFKECLNVYRVASTDWKNPVVNPKTRCALYPLPLIVSDRQAGLAARLEELIWELCPREYAPYRWKKASSKGATDQV